MTLLEKALGAHSENRNLKRDSDEEIEVVMAFLKGQISSAQASHGLGCQSANVYSRSCAALRRLIISGEYRIVRAVDAT
jgi:hypothetical protein